MEDSSTVAVGDGQPSGGGLLSNKRNLLILAAVLGGGAGLVILLMRRSATSATGGTAAAYNQTDVQLGNLANQLLQFRGEASQQAADTQAAIGSSVDTQHAIAADLNSTLGTNQSALTSLLQLLGANLGKGLSDISGQVSDVRQQQNNLAAGISSVGTQVGHVSGTLDNLSVSYVQGQASIASLFDALLRGQQSLLGGQTSISGSAIYNGSQAAQAQAESRSLFQALFDTLGRVEAAQSAVPLDTFRTVTTVPFGSSPDATRAHQAPTGGAGGFSTIEFLPSIHDAGDGSANDWTALMASGPVRYL